MAAAERQVRNRWWATIGVGALACAACCVLVPTLAAAGVIGSGLLRVGAEWREALGFTLVAIGVVGLLVTQVRSYRRRCAVDGGCSGHVGSACGCLHTAAASGDAVTSPPPVGSSSMVLRSILLFVLAAVAEIGGAWLVWQGVREHKGWLWAGLGVIALGIYGFVATLQPDAHFGRILARRWPIPAPRFTSHRRPPISRPLDDGSRSSGAGLDGVVAKPLTITYQPDKRVMFKIKHQRTADCVIAGYRVHKSSDAAIGSLLSGSTTTKEPSPR